MEIDKVKELIQLMLDNDLSSISLRSGEEEITLHRPSANGSSARLSEFPQQIVLSPNAVAPTSVALTSSQTNGAPAVDENLVKITSPMVGTFYTSPNPEAAPYVKVGSKVTANSVVCIIEAMKVFNEIQSEVAGTIEKILVDNQQAVEYGQPLFVVRPD